jgi:hypothetical protein
VLVHSNLHLETADYTTTIPDWKSLILGRIILFALIDLSCKFHDILVIDYRFIIEFVESRFLMFG